MQFSNLINDFAHHVGILDLTRDDGPTVIEVEGVNIGIHHDTAFGRVALLADAGRMPEGGGAEFASRLLKLNLTIALSGGHSCALSEDAKKCLCTVSMPLAGLDVDRLEREIAFLAKSATSIRDLLAVVSENPAATAVGPQTDGAELLIRI